MTEQASTIQIYQDTDGKTALEVKLDQETVWLSLNQMVLLFERDKSVVSRHLKNIFSTGELDRNAVVAFFATTAADQKTYQVEYFNLDAHCCPIVFKAAPAEDLAMLSVV
jgi:hypothetical protein